MGAILWQYGTADTKYNKRLYPQDLLREMMPSFQHANSFIVSYYTSIKFSTIWNQEPRSYTAQKILIKKYLKTTLNVI